MNALNKTALIVCSTLIFSNLAINQASADPISTVKNAEKAGNYGKKIKNGVNGGTVVESALEELEGAAKGKIYEGNVLSGGAIGGQIKAGSKNAKDLATWGTYQPPKNVGTLNISDTTKSLTQHARDLATWGDYKPPASVGKLDINATLQDVKKLSRELATW